MERRTFDQLAFSPYRYAAAIILLMLGMSILICVLRGSFDEAIACVAFLIDHH
jgi:hypothetical protein